MTVGAECGSGTFGNVEESVYLVLLNGLSGISHTVVVCDDAASLKGVKATDEGARGGTVVEVYDSDGHVLRLPIMHQVCEKDDDGNWEDDHAEPVDGVLDE